MKEGLIGRVGRIISGSFNSLVDAIENVAPETVMAEAVREIDGAIDEVRAELGRVVANKHLASTRLMEENRRHVDLGKKIELAVKEGRDDLAEAAIAQQLDIEAQLPVLESTLKDLGGQEMELEGYIRALQAKKRQMNEDLRRFRESQQRAAAGEAPVPGDTGTASPDQKVAKATSAFERIVEKATGLPASGQGQEREMAVKMAELEDMAQKNRVRERLAAVKGKVGS